MSELLHFSEHTLQELALLTMAVVYTIRIIWFTRFKAGKERQAATGAMDTTRRRGILYSWFNVAQPNAMESTRKKRFMYIQFVIFHLGVVLAILMSFLIPYAPMSMEPAWVIMTFQIVIGAAFLVALMRIVRRVSDKYMRAISTPDDYFSLILLTVWFGFATLAVPNDVSKGETILLTYFMLTAFFLFYVPFSKISHYLYYPFTRYYLGKSLGHRGVYPIVRKPETRRARA